MFSVDDSKITRDEKVMGFESKVERQIDVAIRAEVGTYQMFVAIECKAKARPIDVAEVGSFATMIRDVRANKGVMISKSGFTPGALNMGKANGLDLIDFDISSAEVDGLSTLPVLAVQILHAWSCEARLLSHSFLQDEFRPSHTLELLSSSGERFGTLDEFVKKCGQDGHIPDRPGEILLTSDSALFVSIKGTLVRADVRARVRITRRCFFHVTSVERVMMTDALTHDTVRSFLRTGFIYLQPWDEKGSEQGWTEIGSPEELAVTPFQTIFSGSNWYA